MPIAVFAARVTAGAILGELLRPFVERIVAPIRAKLREWFN